MFKNYKELIEKSSFKGQIGFVDGKAVRISCKGKEVPLPTTTVVFIPGKLFGLGKFLGRFTSTEYLELMESEPFKGIDEITSVPNIPNVEGKEFYCFISHHGYDDDNDRMPWIIGLLIEASYLEKRRNQDIKPGTDLYKLLKGFEDLKFPQNRGRDTVFNPALKLEEKIIQHPNVKEGQVVGV